LYSSFFSLVNLNARMASNNVQRNNLRNNLNSQLICGVYGARAFGCKWHVFQSGAYIEPGDYVEADEIIARIETDKVTVDITSP